MDVAGRSPGGEHPLGQQDVSTGGDEASDAGPPPTVKKKKRKRRKKSVSGKWFPYVEPGKLTRTGSTRYGKQGKAHGGYPDMRVRRRDGPLCATCGRRHYAFQGCWSGPLNVKRDRKREHVLAEAQAAAAFLEAYRASWEEAAHENAVRDAAERDAETNKRGPVVERRVPLEEGTREWGDRLTSVERAGENRLVRRR